jgi:uncharacterized protein YjbJ (UPF0337 family)
MNVCGSLIMRTIASVEGKTPAPHSCVCRSSILEGRITMDANIDQVKGKVEEAAGSLTGNKDLESEGKADRRAGDAKEKLAHAKDKIEEVIDDVEAKVEGVVDRAKDALHRK